MKILIIGGTSFMGPVVIRQLVAMQHHLTVFHRGETLAELPASVNHILGDRHSLLKYRSEFEKLAPDVVLDMIPYTQSDAQGVVETFKGTVDRVVGISSQDVYCARDILWGRGVGMLDPTLLNDHRRSTFSNRCASLRDSEIAHRLNDCCLHFRARDM